MIDKKIGYSYLIYITTILLLNLLGTKILYLFDVSIACGFLFIPFIYIINDAVNEVYGKKTATFFVNSGTIALIIAAIISLIMVFLPSDPNWSKQESYNDIFFSSARMTIAGLVAFFISQKLDVTLFQFIKKHNFGTLYSRSVISSIIGLTIDTVIFMLLAFYKSDPLFTISYLFKMSFVYLIVKLIVITVSSAFVPLVAKQLRK